MMPDDGSDSGRNCAHSATGLRAWEAEALTLLTGLKRRPTFLSGSAVIEIGA
jgi:hypothetical protein